MNTLLAALCLLAGWTLLYLASQRTRAELGKAAPRPALCQGVALLLALGAFAVCIIAQGPGMGSLLWLMLLCVCAFPVVALATWAPHWPAALLARRRVPPSGRGQGL
ncbi:hypothetical protein D3C72_2258720 [compost metagenome]